MGGIRVHGGASGRRGDAEILEMPDFVGVGPAQSVGRAVLVEPCRPVHRTEVDGSSRDIQGGLRRRDPPGRLLQRTVVVDGIGQESALDRGLPWPNGS